MSDVFELEPRDPVSFRQETRKSTFILIIIFAVLAMGTSTLSVSYFGEPGGNNFVWNAGGVFVGLVLTTLIFKMVLWHHPVMSASVYGWKLKRYLMQITNIMHHVEAGVEQNNPDAVKLLRFYHLGLMQMHRLEGNDGGVMELLSPTQALLEKMEALDLDSEQTRFYSVWIDALKNGNGD